MLAIIMMMEGVIKTASTLTTTLMAKQGKLQVGALAVLGLGLKPSTSCEELRWGPMLVFLGRLH